MNLFEETKTILDRYKIRPEKELGQSFLIDESVFDKIIETLDPKTTDSILEIGSGLGILTKRVAGMVNKLFACEIDQRLLRILKENLSDVEILDTDILKLDTSLLAPSPNKCFGNIPYYITTPIISHLLNPKSKIKNPKFSTVLLLTQYEVAERLLAKEGENFGMLPALIQTFTKPTLICRVTKDSFYPKPKVDSALLKMEILEKPSVEISDERLFFALIETAFSQRRKTILNSLSSFISKKKLILLLKDVGIDPMLRPERLTLSDFAKITQILMKSRQ